MMVVLLISLFLLLIQNRIFFTLWLLLVFLNGFWCGLCACVTLYRGGEGPFYRAGRVSFVLLFLMKPVISWMNVAVFVSKYFSSHLLQTSAGTPFMMTPSSSRSMIFLEAGPPHW